MRFPCLDLRGRRQLREPGGLAGASPPRDRRGRRDFQEPGSGEQGYNGNRRFHEAITKVLAQRRCNVVIKRPRFNGVTTAS
jgi:hypothetical protein